MQKDAFSSMQGLSSSMIREVVFDLGGVFFMWPEKTFFDRWAHRLGFAPDMFHRLLWYGPDIEAANIGLITAKEYCRRGADRLRVHESVVHEIICHAFYSENVDANLVEYVGQLKKRLRVSALTNTWSFGRSMIEERGLSKHFDVIVTSSEEGIRKPDARIYDITVRRLAVAPAEVIFIDDTEENVLAARAIGMHGVLFKGTGQLIGEMEELLAWKGDNGRQEGDRHE